MKTKKILLPILVLSAFGCIAFGTATAVSLCNADSIAVYAEEIPSEEQPSEETDKWKELYEQAMAKFDEIRNKQIAGTTVGALVGAIVGAIVSFIPAMLNRSNIHRAIDTLSLSRNHVEVVHDDLVKIKEDFKIEKEEFNKVIQVTEATSKSMEQMEKLLQKALDDNQALHNENAELKALVMDLFGQSEVLVALGVSEEVLKKYKK